MIILLKVILLILLADFISGIGHWLEDVYGNPNDTWIGRKIVQPNLQHHKTPRSFLQGSYWDRNGMVIIICVFLMIIITIIFGFYWGMFFVLTYLSQVNEIHAISHRSDKENNWLFRSLQKIGLIQTRKHHGWHHQAPYNCNYCILTAYLNPILDKLQFWFYIEMFLQKVLKIQPLRGTDKRNKL